MGGGSLIFGGSPGALGSGSLAGLCLVGGGGSCLIFGLCSIGLGGCLLCCLCCCPGAFCTIGAQAFQVGFFPLGKGGKGLLLGFARLC